MAACCSAAKAKNTKAGASSKRDFPHQGTLIRQIYDRFFENKGKPIEFLSYEKGKKTHYSSQIEYMRNSYGLDIRRLRNGTWILAGEWVGKGYIDYTIIEE